MFKITAKMIPNKEILGIRHSFDAYMDVQINNESSFVNEDTYFSVIYDFFKFISLLLIKGRTVELPEDCGDMVIEGQHLTIKYDLEGRPKLPPDWQETKKLWERDKAAKEKKQLIYHLNDETNNIRYRLNWYKSLAASKNKSDYSFTACRQFKKAISSSIRKGQEYAIKQKKL